METFILKCDQLLTRPDHLDQFGGGIFFDRDGTIIEERHYLKDSAELQLLPETIPALQQLQQTGMPLYLITNQAGIAHGHFSEAALQKIHETLIQLLAREQIQLRGILYCPHHPNAIITPYQQNCFCRKPHPGLLYQAAWLDRLDLGKSFLIGDKLIDIEAGKRAGTKSILMLTGYGDTEQLKISHHNTPDFIAANLIEAAAWIIKTNYSAGEPD